MCIIASYYETTLIIAHIIAHIPAIIARRRIREISARYERDLSGAGGGGAGGDGEGGGGQRGGGEGGGGEDGGGEGGGGGGEGTAWAAVGSAADEEVRGGGEGGGAEGGGGLGGSEGGELANWRWRTLGGLGGGADSVEMDSAVWRAAWARWTRRQQGRRQRVRIGAGGGEEGVQPLDLLERHLQLVEG